MPLNLTYRNREAIKSKYPEVFEALEDILDLQTQTMTQANISPSGQTSAPPPISSLSVVASGGVFDMSIVDFNPVTRGINYFIEYSTTPSFVAPTVIDLGASRNHRANLGNQTFFFRAYSAYPTSPRSNPVYFGTQSNPTGVVGGGTFTGPAPQASQGSGTSNGASSGDGGFGNQQSRGKNNPL